jgi:preprotein translocase subunit SecF
MKLPHVDIVKYRKFWFGISLVLMVPGLIAIVICFMQFGAPLKPGIDFTGGSLMQYQFQKDVHLDDVRQVLHESGLEGSQVQEAQISGKEVIVLRTKALADEKEDASKVRRIQDPVSGQGQRCGRTGTIEQRHPGPGAHFCRDGFLHQDTLSN